MSTSLIDISMPLMPGMPAWPGSPGVQIHEFKAIGRGDAVNASQLAMDVHCGTHIDAPGHTLAQGATMAGVPLEALIGPAEVIQVGQVDAVAAAHLDALAAGLDAPRILLRTRNSLAVPSDGVFDENYCALTPDGAAWIVEHGFQLVGIDSLSIEPFTSGGETHDILLRAGIAILEGLDLRSAPAGSYHLTCLPLALPQAEAAPARAILSPGRAGG